MKRTFLTIMAALALTLSATAQSFNIFNHLGADVSVGTTGIGVELSTPITNFIQLRGGLSVMTGFKFNTNVDGTLQVASPVGTVENPFTMDLTGKLARTQGDIIFNVYPFGSHSGFFVAGGAYFGGKELVKITGHSDQVADLQAQGILESGWVEIGDYKVDLEPEGNVRGGLVVKNFRPYLGLGFGRPCPKGRIGVMFEAGVQFMGKMKVCQGRNLDPIDVSDLGNDDDWQKWIDKLTVYPMVKLTISGRLF